MSAINNTPENKNFLSPLNFQFQLKRAPHVNFFVQKANIPGVTVDFPQQDTPFVHIPISGEHINFEDLEISFKVDEDFQNWFEIHNWIRALGFPFNYEEYKKIQANPIVSGQGIVSDISLIVLNQVKQPIFDITFRDAFPISLSDLNFNVTDDDVNYLTASAEFRYILYDVVKL
jgi:hypothetical protein